MTILTGGTMQGTVAHSAQRHSNSSLDTYKSCPTLYNLTYEGHLEPVKPGPAHDLDYGGAWHMGLEVLYGKGGSLKKAKQAFMDSYPALAYPIPLPVWSQGKTFSGGVNALTAYCEKWIDEDRHWKILRVEKLETARGTGDDDSGHVLKLDLVIEDGRDGLIYGVDHKLTGKYLDDKYWSTFELNSQIRTYLDHLKKQYPGRVGGFIINAASLRYRSKAVTPRKGPNKGILQPAGEWCDFKRMIFNPNSDCLKLEQDNIAYWTSRIEHDRLTGRWGYNTQQCNRGGVPCAMRPICYAGYQWPRDEEAILVNYRQVCRALLKDGNERCQLDYGHAGLHNPERPRRLLTEEDFVFEDDPDDSGGEE